MEEGSCDYKYKRLQDADECVPLGPVQAGWSSSPASGETGPATQEKLAVYADQPGPPPPRYENIPDAEASLRPPAYPAKDHTCLAIAACLLCVWPLGLVAIWFAHKAQSSNYLGDYPSAHASAKTAKLLINFSCGLGVCLHIINVIIVIVMLSSYDPNED